MWRQWFSFNQGTGQRGLSPCMADASMSVPASLDIQDVSPEYNLHLCLLGEQKQTASVVEYTTAFWECVHRVLDLNPNLSIKSFVHQYIEGLREDIQYFVRSRSPSSITGASSLARIREDEIVQEAAMAAERLDDSHGVHVLMPTVIIADAFPKLGAPVECGADHNVIAMDSNSPAAPTPITCLMECPSRNATVDIFPEPAAAAVCEEALDIDTGSVAAPTPAICSTGLKPQGQAIRPASWPSFIDEHTTTAHDAIGEPPPIPRPLGQAESEVLQSKSNPLNSPGGTSVDSLWCLVDVFWRLQNWWSDAQCVQSASAIFEALSSAERHNTGIPLQVLVVGSVLNLFLSVAAPSSLMTAFLVGGHLWREHYVPYCILRKTTEEEKRFHTCAAANQAMRLFKADRKPFSQAYHTSVLFAHSTLQEKPTYSIIIIASCDACYNPSYTSVFNWRFSARGVSIEDLLGGSHVVWHLSFVLFDIETIWKGLPSLQPKPPRFLSSQVIFVEVIFVIPPTRKWCSAGEKAVLIFGHQASSTVAACCSLGTSNQFGKTSHVANSMLRLQQSANSRVLAMNWVEMATAQCFHHLDHGPWTKLKNSGGRGRELNEDSMEMLNGNYLKGSISDEEISDEGFEEMPLHIVEWNEAISDDVVTHVSSMSFSEHGLASTWEVFTESTSKDMMWDKDLADSVLTRINDMLLLIEQDMAARLEFLENQYATKLFYHEVGLTRLVPSTGCTHAFNNIGLNLVSGAHSNISSYYQ